MNKVQRPEFDNPQRWFCRGIAAMEQGDYHEAEECFRKARAAAPNSVETILNLGYVLDKQGRSEEAFHCYEEVLAITPESAKAHYNQASHLLRTGDFVNGLKKYECRFAAIPGTDDRVYTQPRWDGSSLHGRSILVYCEQGLGDTLMFARYLPLLADCGAHIVLEVQEQLVLLLQGMPAVEQVVVKTSSPPHTDCYIPLLSLPYLFHTTLDSIPQLVPYLEPPCELIATWRERINPVPDDMHIGLVWSGKQYPYPNRSCPPEHLLPLVAMRGASFYSLQLGTYAALPVEIHSRIVDVASNIKNFADTAAIVANLDLVITIDTAVAHLAGAMGKPVWVMLPYAADWRWMEGRQDSPWYPTMRLFRQLREGDWQAVIDEVVCALQSELAREKEPVEEHADHAALLSQALQALEHNKPTEARAVLGALAQQLPDEPAVWFNLGRAQECMGALAEAEVSLQRAHVLYPESVDVLLHLGKVLVRQDKTEEAFACCDRMQKLQPDNPLVRFNLAYLQLRTGNYQAGFANFEARLAVESFGVDLRQYLQPRWAGEALQGKSILVFGEQGMGDVIQFVRYVPMLAQLGGRVVLEVDPPLIPLLQGFPGVDKIVVKAAQPPHTDCYIQLLSLPYMFGTTLETVPNLIPYLKPEQVKNAKWCHLLSSHASSLRIGLVWRGNPKNPMDQERSCPFSQLEPLFSLAGVQFFSLQIGEGVNELANAGPEVSLIDYTERLHDLSDTAALIANLDLVIGVDTAVIHLAGALGRPVWVMLSSVADWRWIKERDDTPWYPSARLFWQHHPGDWGGLVVRVRDALQLLVLEQSAPVEYDRLADVYQRGCQLKEAGDLRGAEQCFRRVVDTDATLPDPQHSLAVVLQMQGRPAEAIAHYQAAIAQDSEFVQAYYNAANTLVQLGRPTEALETVRALLRLESDNADAHWLLGMLLLLLGEYSEGWREYEWRWKAKSFLAKLPDLGRPQWDGTPLGGKTLLIQMEQGRGDMIQFVRFAPLVTALGGRVIVRTVPELVSLMAVADGVQSAVSQLDAMPVCDLVIPALSLPRVLGTTLETIPATVPYIRTDQQRVEAWRKRLPVDGSLRVGLAWQGADENRDNQNRSCPLRCLSVLADLEGISFYSLQLGAGRDQLLQPDNRLQVHDFTEHINDFADTAALIENLDLVISVCTSVTHLAGALGKPVWTLLHFAADWRWLVEREDSPWYPTMRLFRQTAPGDWPEVVERVRHELDVMCATAIFHNQRGIELLQQGDLERSERLFSGAIQLKPGYAEAYANRGAALHAAGCLEEAFGCYQQAVELKPEFLQAFFNMGNVCRALGRLEQARACYRRTLELKPGFIAALIGLGEIAKELREFGQAREYYSQALASERSSVDALQGLAETYQAEERFEEAIHTYRLVVEQQPDRAAVWNQLGTVYQCLEQLDEAESCYRRALQLLPGQMTVLNNLGVVLIARGELVKALAVLHEVVSLYPEYAEGHWNLAVALLAAGRYQEGWPEFEWRFKKTNPVPQRAFSQPRWDGSSLAGKVILLHAEQGFGDTIQMARYLPLMVQQAERVVLECQLPSLKRLLISVSTELTVIAAGEPLPHFDCHLPLMSLPLVFGTTLETIPVQVPYLHADPGDVAVWQRRLGKSERFKVGIVWYAKQTQVLNRKRSCPLEHFAPLWQVPGVSWYSLQIGPGSEQLGNVTGVVPLEDLTPLLHDFADTAACMANLDLIITIDTAAAHLAGALGRPVWVVLPHVAEWRWLEERSDSPWYPTMQLFRQPDFGDWSALMAQVAVTLRNQVQKNGYQQVGGTLQNAARLRVGLAWAGRQDNPLNRKRSCPFELLAPLFELAQIDFVSLQLPPAGHDERLIDLTDHLHDFEDTAALMANLDLVISIDTAVAHLAGALGRPTWVLLAHVADWRWVEIEGSCPWYPGIQLFRQPDFGDWGAVVREVGHRLLGLSGNVMPAATEWADPAATDERQRLELLLLEKRASVASNPASPDAWLDAGAAAALLGHHKEASGYFRQALRHDPELVAAHLNLGYTLLAQGIYEEGWPQLEWRLHRIPAGQLPPWPLLQQGELGSHPPGTTILVHCEQGYGDTIQFCRFLPSLKDAGYRVLISCQPAMAALLSSVRGVDRIIPHGEPLPTCDLQVLMLSLPLLFSTTLTTLPRELPYLQPRLQKIVFWERLLSEQLQRTKKIVK